VVSVGEYLSDSLRWFNAASSRYRPRFELGKGPSVLEVAVQGSCADRAVFEILATGYLVWKPMKTIGSVGCEFLQAGHLADFWRYPDEIAPIKVEMLDCL
jgi:hypothetical protein